MEVNNLKAYLANIGMKLSDFCKLVDCDPSYMSSIANGKKKASRRLAKDIEIATHGLIKLETRLRKRDHKRQEQEKQNNQE